jgi:GNAT superfamily N-acetyltransferase
MVIRRGQLEDLEAIVSHNRAMAGETEDRVLNEQACRAGTRAVLENPENGFYVVAEDNSRVIGQLLVTREWSDWRNGFFWWIQSVYVIPEARWRGVFRTLYTRLLDDARNAKNVCGLRLYVDKHNRTAQAVYRSLGIKETRYEMYEVDFILP